VRNAFRFASDLIREAGRLQLTDLIAASFPIGLGMPVVLTGIPILWPYNHLLFAFGSSMIGIGGALLLYRAFKYAAAPPATAKQPRPSRSQRTLK
jgi:hypothetical protein